MVCLSSTTFTTAPSARHASRSNNHETTCSCTVPLICIIAQSHPNSISSRLSRHWEASQSSSTACSLQRIAAGVVRLAARVPSSHISYCKRSENMRTCSNASLGALPKDGRTRVVVGLGDTAASIDINPFAWTKSADPGQEAGRDTIPPISENEAISKHQESGRQCGCLLFGDPCLRVVARR